MMDDPSESITKGTNAGDVAPAATKVVDDADAAIAWYLSDEFEEHLDRCFGEAKKQAILERERFLESRRHANGAG